MADVRKLIDEKIKAYVPDDQKDENAEFTGTDMISVGQILFRFADSSDLVYFYIGVFSSFCFGGALPGFCLFFGEMIDAMGESTAAGGFGSLKE